jgi:hypothetical protein
MYQILARGFSRSLEWVLLALVCGCTLWVTFLALGFRAPGI